MTAFICAGDKRSAMPSGRIRTGFRIPKTPGSMCADEDITGIDRLSGNGDAVRLIARICRSDRNQKIRMTITPQSHVASKIIGSAPDAWVGGIAVDTSVKVAKGWLI